jgi:hypothetical protein
LSGLFKFTPTLPHLFKLGVNPTFPFSYKKFFKNDSYVILQLLISKKGWLTMKRISILSLSVIMLLIFVINISWGAEKKKSIKEDGFSFRGILSGKSLEEQTLPQDRPNGKAVLKMKPISPGSVSDKGLSREELKKLNKESVEYGFYKNWQPERFEAKMGTEYGIDNLPDIGFFTNTRVYLVDGKIEKILMGFDSIYTKELPLWEMRLIGPALSRRCRRLS